MAMKGAQATRGAPGHGVPPAALHWGGSHSGHKGAPAHEELPPQPRNEEGLPKHKRSPRLQKRGPCHPTQGREPMAMEVAPTKEGSPKPVTEGATGH